MAVIRTGDLNESMEQALESSQFLIDAGFTVLVLCLCPEGRRSAVPAEYAEHTVKWLRERLGENIRTAMTGTSGGALYTLTCACFIPEIVCAAVCSPFDHMMEGTAGRRPAGSSVDIPGRRGYAVHAMGRPAEGKRRSVRKGAVFKRLRAAPYAEVHI